jgi:hypothetical protein
LALPQKVPKIWDLLKQFKESCHRKGWQTSDYEDIVKIGDEYHNFIGTRKIHPSTFKRIACKRKLAVPEGKSYQVISVSYTAMVLQQPPSERLVETLAEDSELAKKTALYDLSGIYEGKQLCLKVNETESRAFDEFEKFLKKTYGVETRPLYQPQTNKHKTFKSKLLNTPVG